MITKRFETLIHLFLIMNSLTRVSSGSTLPDNGCCITVGAFIKSITLFLTPILKWTVVQVQTLLSFQSVS